MGEKREILGLKWGFWGGFGVGGFGPHFETFLPNFEPFLPNFEPFLPYFLWVFVPVSIQKTLVANKRGVFG